MNVLIRRIPSVVTTMRNTQLTVEMANLGRRTSNRTFELSLVVVFHFSAKSWWCSSFSDRSVFLISPSTKRRERMLHETEYVASLRRTTLYVMQAAERKGKAEENVREQHGWRGSERCFSFSFSSLPRVWKFEEQRFGKVCSTRGWWVGATTNGISAPRSEKVPSLGFWMLQS